MALLLTNIENFSEIISNYSLPNGVTWSDQFLSPFFSYSPSI